MQNTISLVREDWTPRNLLGLKKALSLGYDWAREFCDGKKHEVFTTPNKPLALGFLRWIAVDHYLKVACDAGWIEGISAVWKPLGGRKSSFPCNLELVGAHTNVIAVHAQDEEETPRHSKNRYNKRALNEQCPLLTGFVDPYDDDGHAINLLLVHGGQNAEFAQLRAYTSVDTPSTFAPFSGNLMEALPIVSPIDVEEIPEPTILVQPHAARSSRSRAQS